MAEVGALRITLGLNSIDFTRGMQDVNRRLTALNSEFRAITSGAGKFDNSLETLRSRSDILTRSMQTHRTKVEELRRQYEQAKTTQGETAAETLKLATAYNRAVTAMNTTEQQLRSVNRQIQEQSNGFNQLESAVNAAVSDISREIRLLDSAFAAATAGIDDFGSSVQDLEQREDHLTQTLRLQESRVDELNRLHQESVRANGADAQATQELAIRLNGATQAMRETEAQLRQNTNQIQQQSSAWRQLSQRMANTGEGMNQLGGRMQSVGSEISQSFGAAFLAVGAGLGLSAKRAMDFESQISSVKSVMSPDEVLKFSGSLEELALQMGAKTKYSAMEAAEGIEELIKAGVTVTDIINGGLEGALSLAVAGELELADAAEIASTALNAFKDDNLSVMRAADLLAGAANASATSVSEMKFGLSMVSAVASGVGLSFEGTTAALASFAQNGLKGSDAGTSLKTMLLNLSPSTEAASTEMANLGLLTEEGTSAFYDAEGSIKSLSEIAELLKTKLARLTDEQRQMALKTMFGTDAIRAANILYKEGAQGIDSMVEAMNKIKSADVAAEKLNNVKGRIEILKGSAETAAISFGNALLPTIDKVVEVIQELTDKFNGLSPEMQETIAKGAMVTAAILGVVTAIGAFIAILGGAISGVGALVTAFSTVVGAIGVVTTGVAAATPAIGALAGAITFITGPIGLAIAGLAALGFGAYKLSEEMKKPSIQAEIFTEDISEATQEAVGSFLEMNDGVTEQLNLMRWGGEKVTKEMADSITGTFSKMADQILAGLEEDHAARLETMNKFFENSMMLTDKEQQGILKKIEETYLQQKDKVENGEKIINDIWAKALAENRDLTTAEYTQINNIKEGMVNDGIRILSDSEIESKIILERMKADASIISAEQAAEVVKNSKDQKDKAVAEAEKQYKETYAQILQMRDGAGELTADMAARMIADAEKQRKDTVRNAEDMHQKVVTEAQKQAEEHIANVNWETGEVLSKWELTKNKAITIWELQGVAAKKLYNNMKDNVIESAETLKNSAIEKYESLKSGALDKFEELKNKGTEKIVDLGRKIVSPIEEAKNKISEKVDAIKGFFDNMELKLPSIKLPKLPEFHLTGEFSLMPPSVPKLDVTWNAKGALFTRPTIFNTPLGLQGFGEAGPEAALPLNDAVLGKIGEMIVRATPGFSGQQANSQIYQDTFQSSIVIQAPASSSPSDLARKALQAQRQMAIEWRR
ncbi:phage tail tape measure protein [Bacillus infantis]|uniref:Phage tail tape measure protein n=1 Tax=Bacillus infantis TaxID=324767 RepID=A0A5D4RFA4_9BACI|nr:phage tail tape measure protein [Bacillus infantis]TYS50085.1 phage tail tape measure protein [Bacillus infantis]